MATHHSPAPGSDETDTPLDEFEDAFLALRDSLHSFLLRTTANRADADDLVQDTYVRARNSIEQFAGRSSLKTWIFRIGYNLARDNARTRQRWRDDIQDRCRASTQAAPEKVAKMRALVANSPADQYEFREHIDYCFTCLGKTLPIENQVTLILKTIYGFKISDICDIVELSEGKVKHALANARQTLTEIFDRRCSLINSQGICHQCSEMSGFFNPKQDAQQRKMQLHLVQQAQKGVDTNRLLSLRLALIAGVDPNHAPGSSLHAYLLDLMQDHVD